MSFSPEQFIFGKRSLTARSGKTRFCLRLEGQAAALRIFRRWSKLYKFIANLPLSISHVKYSNQATHDPTPPQKKAGFCPFIAMNGASQI
jgi:hypothetical protein